MAAVLLIALSVVVHFTIDYWGDQDWELLVARMLAQGKTLYVDHVPVNPPLIFWLYMIPAGLALHTAAFTDWQALVALTLLVSIFTILVSTRLMARHPAFAASGGQRLGFAVLLAFLFIFRIASPFFGDREHLFLVLTFPYLLRWMPSLARVPLPLRMRLAIGVLAAFGFLIKPQCFVVFLGLQLVALLRKDRPAILMSVENLCVYAATVLYAVAIALFARDYYTSVFPLSLFTYSAISAGPGDIFDATLLLTLVLTFVFFRPRHATPYRRDIYYLLLGSLCFLAYALINAGWGYTYQPIITLLLFLNGFVLLEFLYLRRTHAARGLPALAFSGGIATCALNFALKLAIVLVFFHAVLASERADRAAIPEYYRPFVEEVRQGNGPHSFGMIGMNFALFSRVAKLSGASWDTRYPQFWMIPKFLVAGSGFAEEHKWILYAVAGALADDLERKKPPVVFVDISDTIYTLHLARPFDWVGAFSRFANFAEAWQHYAYERTIDECATPDPAEVVREKMMGIPPGNHLGTCRFDVYRRKE